MRTWINSDRDSAKKRRINAHRPTTFLSISGDFEQENCLEIRNIAKIIYFPDGILQIPPQLDPCGHASSACFPFIQFPTGALNRNQ
jgi:hypothetical protein